jgi:hypothetical protein
MIDFILQFSTVAACALIVVRTEPALNRMHRATPLLVRLSFYQLAVAASAEALAVASFCHVPSWREALLAGGVATLMLCERRIRLISHASRRWSRS